MTAHQETSSTPPAWLAWALAGEAAAVVACGIAAATASKAARPGWELLGLWFLLILLTLLGLATARALAVAGSLPRWAAVLIVSSSALAQVPLVFAPAALSDDIHRYVHEGRVLAAGMNPYRLAPSDYSLDEVAGPERTRVNHPDIRAAYPPLAEAGFAVSTILGAGVRGLKAGMACLGLAVVGLVWLLLPGADRHRIVGIAWHPLLLLEVGGSGHFDVAAVLFMLLALWALVPPGPGRRARNLGALALLLGAWVKLLPAALALPLCRWLRLPRALLVAGLGALAALPGLLTKGEGDSQPGLLAYAEHWDFNGIVYPWLRGLIEAADVTGLLQVLFGPDAGWTGPQYVTRAVLGLCWLACLAWGVVRARSQDATLVDAVFPAVAGFILFTPTLHPWYLLWLLPLVVLRPSLEWAWLTAVVGLSYCSAIAALDGPWAELAWVRWVEYLPFLALASWSLLRRWGARARAA